MHAQYRSGADGFKAAGNFCPLPLTKIEKHEAVGRGKGRFGLHIWTRVVAVLGVELGFEDLA
jgi:hypothetical protein